MIIEDWEPCLTALNCKCPMCGSETTENRTTDLRHRCVDCGHQWWLSDIKI